MTKYWNLYVLHIERCVKENYINDIDPHHYEMEWNHFLPRNVFGDWPVGQWLTKKQHAIASALQTLVFKENCMFATHKSFLTPKLLELAWPYYCDSASKRLKKIHSQRDKNGKSLRALKLHAERDEHGKSLHTKRNHAKKDENGKSLLGLKCASVIHAQKNGDGKSVNAVKGGAAAAVVNSKRIEITFEGGEKKIYGSGKEVSKLLGVSPASVTNWAKGRYKPSLPISVRYV